jgi:PAS domain S-box-containing protein
MPEADQRLYETIIANLPLGYSRIDCQGLVVDFNAAAQEITGYAREEIIGRGHLEVFHATDDPYACPLVQHAFLEKESIVGVETVMRHKTGEQLILAVSATPLFDAAGEFAGAVELFRDITVLKKRERERKNILSMFAHDMKNPLAAAGGFLARLLTGKAGALTDSQRKSLGVIQEEFHKLSDLLADFLEYSRVDARQLEPAVRELPVIDHLRRSIDIASVEAKRLGMSIRFEVAATTPDRVRADPSMLDRTMANLINNALAYSGKGSSILVRLSGTPDDLLVSVSDTGRGIPADAMPYLFDAFYRASKSSGSSGLGLFIVKSIVEAHGGRIWVESEENKGSTFSFTLPKQP